MLAGIFTTPLGLVVVAGGFLLVVVLFTMRPTDKVSSSLGGKVIGIVGRMGSGKTYMAVQIAYRHLLAGHRVFTNFTMVLPDDVAPRWGYFNGWDQFAELDNAVVVIDEAQLYAPSYKPLAFPLIARWKLAMARKFKLDVYWISQHEDRVNSTLKALTNLIYVCNAWMGGAWFSAKGYEPEYVRRKGRHLARRSYRFKLENAKLYDTLEIITPDDHLGEEVKSQKLDVVNQLAEGYNARRQGRAPATPPPAALMDETPTERRRSHKAAPEALPCLGSTKNGGACRNRALAGSANQLCGKCEQKGQSVESIVAAAHAIGLDGDLAEAPRVKGERCVHEVARDRPAGVCRRCPVVEPAPCSGLNEKGRPCRKPTTAANGLCDDCVSRARVSLITARASGR